MQYTKEELRTKIEQMRRASSIFYSNAVLIGVHPFIEFTGFLNEYIKICEQNLARGIDFTETSAHSGKALEVAPYEAAYIGEKLGCIFGPSLKEPENWKNFIEKILND